MGRKVACAALSVFLPVSLTADDSGGAILHHEGKVFVNGSPAPVSIAITIHDTVQTDTLSQATINTAGSSVRVAPDTLFRFEGDEVALDHGSVSVSSARFLRVRVGCLTVIPATESWTQYDVVDANGRITVNARKSDVNIEAHGLKVQQGRSGAGIQQVTVREGEQKSRDEHCSAGQKTPDHVAARGAILDSPWAIGTAFGPIVIGTCLAFCHHDDPVSPAVP